MAEYFSLKRRKSPSAMAMAPQGVPEPDDNGAISPVDPDATVLSKAGGAAMTGLHTLGSMLSWPSRLLHGGINAAVGGKGGFGENYLNPFDSTGSVEGSRHLINAGILSENDPSQWEWSDLHRGLADIALDPMTYLIPGGLTNKGLAAEKIAKGEIGALAKGRVAQTAAEQRALLTAKLPFAKKNLFEMGTGAGAAKVAENVGKYSGLTGTRDAIAKSKAAHLWKSMFGAKYRGTVNPLVQAETGAATEANRAADVATKVEAQRIAGSEAMDIPADMQRRAMERAPGSQVAGYDVHPAFGGEAPPPKGNPPGVPPTDIPPGVAPQGVPPVPEIPPAPVVAEATQAAIPAVEEAAQAVAPAVEQAAKPLSVVEAATQLDPKNFLKGGLVSFRDLAKATGKTPDEIVEALNKEIPGGFSMHAHDMPGQIVHEGKQGDFHWKKFEPLTEAEKGSPYTLHGKPYIGFALKPGVGEKLAQQGVPAAESVAKKAAQPKSAAASVIEQIKKAAESKKTEHLGPYLESKPPRQKATAERFLTKQHLFDGQPAVVHEYVEKAVKSGAIVRNSEEGRRLQLGDGAYMTEKVLGKSGMDYAEHLSNKNLRVEPVAATIGTIKKKVKAATETPATAMAEETIPLAGVSDEIQPLSQIASNTDDAARQAAKAAGMSDEEFEAAMRQAPSAEVPPGTMAAVPEQQIAGAPPEPPVSAVEPPVGPGVPAGAVPPQAPPPGVPGITSDVPNDYPQLTRHTESAADPRQIKARLEAQGEVFPPAIPEQMEALRSGQRPVMPMVQVSKKGKILLGGGLNKKHVAQQAEIIFNTRRAELADAYRADMNNAEALAELKQMTDDKKGWIANQSKLIRDEIHASHDPEASKQLISNLVEMGEPGMYVMHPKTKGQRLNVRKHIANVNPVDEEIAKARLPQHHELGAMEKMNAGNLSTGRSKGFGQQSGLVDVIRHFVRKLSETAPIKGATRTISKGYRAIIGRDAEDFIRQFLFKGFHGGTEDVNNLLGGVAVHDARRTGMEAAGRKGAVASVADWIKKNLGHHIVQYYHDKPMIKAIEKNQRRLHRATTALEAAMKAGSDVKPKRIEFLKKSIAKFSKEDDVLRFEKGHDRIQKLAEFIVDHPSMEGQKMFGNAPINDLTKRTLITNKKSHDSDIVTNVLSKHLADGGDEEGMTVREFLKGSGFKSRTIAERILGDKLDEMEPEEITGAIDAVLKSKISPEIAEELNQMVPRYTKPEAVSKIQKFFQNYMTSWKAWTLAAPASRNRDALGGMIFNLLHGWTKPAFFVDAKRIMEGKDVLQDYSHLPWIQDWMKKAGPPGSPLEATLANQTKAIKQRLAVYFPQEIGVLADVPTGQVGSAVEQLTHSVPGKVKKSLQEQMLIDPVRTAMGRGEEGATWFGKPRQPGETRFQALRRRLLHPFTEIAGIGDRTETMSAPILGAQKVSAATDAYNRYQPALQMWHEGFDPGVAAQKVKNAQVDYDPTTFSATERAIKNNIIPFYSFASRVTPEVARELSDFSSPLAQLTRGIDRAQGGDDPSIPDYIKQNTGVPVTIRSDGSKAFLTNMGLMSDQPTKMLGEAAALDYKNLGYDVLAGLNPLIGVPLQRVTNQSFFQAGQPLDKLDPTSGRILSNIGETVGLRDEGSGPITFPGATAADALIGASPVGRYANQVRTIFDPRKDFLSKGADLFSGARISDVSPEKQLSTLQTRAEDLAKRNGAFESRMVGFSKDALAKLAETDPATAAQHQAMQGLITRLKRRRKVRRDKKKAAVKA